jgi:hypothetical protein
VKGIKRISAAYSCLILNSNVKLYLAQKFQYAQPYCFNLIYFIRPEYKKILSLHLLLAVQLSLEGILYQTQFFHEGFGIYVKNTIDQEIIQFLSLSSPILLPPAFFVGDLRPPEAAEAAAAADCCRFAQAKASFGT